MEKIWTRQIDREWIFSHKKKPVIHEWWGSSSRKDGVNYEVFLSQSQKHIYIFQLIFYITLKTFKFKNTWTPEVCVR